MTKWVYSFGGGAAEGDGEMERAGVTADDALCAPE